MTLRTRATLPDEWRGAPLTLAIPFLEAPVALTVDGAPATALEESLIPGHPSLASHRFRIDGERTRAGEIDLELSVDRVSTRGGWLDSIPRISATPEGDRAFLVARALNGPITLATYAILSMIGFTYFVLHFFDRRRLVHLWFALQAAGAAHYTLQALGIPQALGGPSLAAPSMAASGIASVYFVHAYFRIGRPHVVFRVVAALVLAYAIFGSHTFASPIWVKLGGLLVLAGVPYQIFVLARLHWRGSDRFSTGLLLATWIVIGATGVVDAVSLVGLGEIAGGAHTLVLGLGLYAVTQASVLGRDYVRSLRDAEKRVAMLEERDRENARLEAELRRQIADKSERLADALARIGAVPERVAMLAPGDVVHGRYAVIRPLGAGGMGMVHEVERIADGRRFALKVLTAASTGIALARLAREAQIAAQASHENLVAIVDVDVSETGSLYLVMELVEGAPLHDLSARYGDAGWARSILRQVARGLAALHACGVVHRDLKPGNVLVTKEGVAKIADFGIARLGANETPDPLGETALSPIARSSARDVAADPAKDPTLAATPNLALTGTGVLMGTPLYMAPELARGARSAGASSDLWSFGVIAFELLEGRFPFAAPPVLDALARREIPRVRLAHVELEVDERATLERCLAADPAARPAAAEVARVLAGKAY